MTSRSFKYFRYKRHMRFLYRLAGFTDQWQLVQLKIMQLRRNDAPVGKIADLEYQLPLIEDKMLKFINQSPLPRGTNPTAFIQVRKISLVPGPNKTENQQE